MGMSFRKRIKAGKGTAVNVSGSGVSVSKKVGKRASVNSKGKVAVRLPFGVTWRS